MSGITNAIGITATNGYAYEGTFSSKPSASAYPAGTKIWVSDVGINGSEFIGNGTSWTPVNGSCSLYLDNTAVGNAVTGTIGTGSSGHLVLGTSMPMTFSNGIWLYFPAVAGSTPALTAGLYWVVMSNATTGTIYQSGPGSAAFNFSVGSAYTGSTSEFTAKSFTLKGGLLTSGKLVENHASSITASTNNKITKLKIGSSTCTSQTIGGASAGAFTGYSTIMAESSSVQYCSPTFSIGAINTASLTATTENLANDATVSLTLQVASATEYNINHSFGVELYK